MRHLHAPTVMSEASRLASFGGSVSQLVDLRVQDGPSSQYLGTWDLGNFNSNYSTGFGEVYDYWVLGPVG